MVGSLLVQLILDEKSSIGCSHLVPSYLDMLGFKKKKADELEGHLRKRAAAMTLMPAGEEVGSSTSDPTYLPDDRVTSSRFLLCCGPGLGVSSV